jgi:mannose-1-phosphate guanylyltransferase
MAPIIFRPGLELPVTKRQSRRVNQAFILGAGLGTRLRPLTDKLPKPLVPLFHRPLAAWAMEECARVGARRFAINTHHLPEAWQSFPNDPAAQGNEITFFHEPVLLETGGGLKNIGAWIGGDPVLVHNGDIFSTMPLDQLVATHERSGLPVTLALRSNGDAKHIALDAASGRITDIRNKLGKAEGTHVFSGIYCVNPEFLDRISPHEKVSIIPAFLELAAQNLLGGVVLDDGVWLDLGDRESYLEAHRTLSLGPAIHPEAVIGHGAIVEQSVIGPRAVVESGAVVRNSVVWPGGRVESSAEIDGCIVMTGSSASGSHQGVDL